MKSLLEAEIIPAMTTDEFPPEPDKDAPQRSMKRLIRLPSVERGCDGKTNIGRSYAKQADRLAAKHGKQYGVYRCPHCGGTHMTTKLEKSENYAPLIHVSEPNNVGWLDQNRKE